MDPAVSALQNAINRFAAVGGFPRVDVDGLWGTKTRQGAYSALAWVGKGTCYQHACPDQDTATSAAGIIAQWDEGQTAARGLAEFLAGVADDLGIPHVAAPVPSGGGIPIPTGPIVHVSSYSTSIIERIKMLPLWQQVGLGLLMGLGLIIVVNRVRRA